MATIKQIWAREIINSRGRPTVEAFLLLDNGTTVSASVPSGASTGSYEAVDLKDQDPKRYRGRGVLKAVNNVNKVLGPALIGLDPSNQLEIDKRLVELDGTENKSKLGANAILSVSLLTAKGGALVNSSRLYLWINTLARSMGYEATPRMPTPLFNMINGGAHGAGNLDFQEFFVIPASSKKYAEALMAGVEIYMAIGENLIRKGAIHSVGDEGGYAPNLYTNADALEVFVESIRDTSYSMGRDVFLGLDVAANHFYKDNKYLIKDKQAPQSPEEMLEYYRILNDKYNLAILEDPFHEDDWDTWKKLTAMMQEKLAVVGDDLLVTNKKRLEKALSEKAANSILVKPNQVGTISETIEVVKLAKANSWKVVVSHRSGETNDHFIADFAVGVGADYVKFGAPARGERVSKYNRLSTIETELSLPRK